MKMSERKWCEHMAEGWIDNCPDCRIAELETENKMLKRALSLLDFDDEKPDEI
jgi:hypothetical protein